MTSSRQRLWVSLGLAALVVMIYSGVWHCGFLDYDDPTQVLGNEHVTTGLTWANMVWAFTHWHLAQWMPLTWMSHMLDVSLFGLDPGPHHLVNVAFHLANVLLLFAVLLRMTGAFWRSAVVAALFAAHPLNVESVAWVTERKNVLNTACWLLTLLAYARYAEKQRMGWLVVTTLCMALGVMSKSMIVTLPFALLLLDGWPLRRFGSVRWQRLVVEKLPLFALSAFGCWAQLAESEIIGVAGTFPLSYRLASAAANALRYLGQLIVPVQVALPYPMARTAPVGLALASLAIFSGILFWAWRRRATVPFVLVGLLWYLGTLMPVSGLVQVGDADFANRFVYVPQIGVFIALVWTLERWLREKNRFIAPALVAACLAIFSVISARYVARWENTITLFTYCAKILPGSPKAQGLVGRALTREGRWRESIPYYRATLQLSSRNVQIRTELGTALSKTGDVEGAITEFRRAAADETRPGAAAFNLGTHLMRQDRPAEAIPVLEAVSRANPADLNSHYWLGRAYEATARPDEALRAYRQALALSPADAFIQEAVRRLAGE